MERYLLFAYLVWFIFGFAGFNHFNPAKGYYGWRPRVFGIGRSATAIIVGFATSLSNWHGTTLKLYSPLQGWFRDFFYMRTYVEDANDDERFYSAGIQHSSPQDERTQLHKCCHFHARTLLNY